MGLSYSFIAKLVKLHPSTISKFMSDNLLLSKAKYELLDELTYNLFVALGVE